VLNAVLVLVNLNFVRRISTIDASKHHDVVSIRQGGGSLYVREIHIDRVRHLENVHLGPFPQPILRSEAIALAGPNGGGKSTVLELLGLALSNSLSLTMQANRSLGNLAFEIAIAVTPDELHVIRRYAEQSQRADAEEILTYLEEHGYYYRAFGYTEGKHREKAAFYDRVHDLVTTVLWRPDYGQTRGFWIRSDRQYPATQFEQRKLLSSLIPPERFDPQVPFGFPEAQYMHMFDFLVQQRYYYIQQLGFESLRSLKSGSRGEPVPPDPLEPYDKLLNKLFPNYRFAQTEEKIPTNLFVELPSGQVVPFHELSSGEKEVFFILSFLLRHNVHGAVILIDEPELHLHPELARSLIRTMQEIRPGNQIWMATHNAEIIDEVGRDKVIYLALDQETRKPVVTLGSNEAESMRHLKNLFGYSGYIGVAKTMVFLEGLDKSSDRKLFSSLFPEYGSQLKFIPCETSENLLRINSAVLAILESNWGWMRFCLIRDRDFLTPEMVAKYQCQSPGRVYVLDRYHIENYLLDEELIARVQSDIFNKPTEPRKVRQKLTSIARKISGEVLRNMVTFRLNLIYRPQDFSLGEFLQGQSILRPDGKLDVKKVELLERRVTDKVSTINKDLAVSTERSKLITLLTNCQNEIKQALTGDSETWKSLFPGRRLLEEYAKAEGLDRCTR
jgi:ABC-type lipoprotein export system ATPase subunit